VKLKEFDLTPKGCRRLSELALEALQRGVDEAIALHARNGVSIVVMRKGRMVELDARRILAARRKREPRAKAAAKSRARAKRSAS